MFLNLMDHQTELWMEGLFNHPNLSFALRSHYDMPGHYSSLKIDLKNQPDEVDSGDNGFGNELSAIPSGPDPAGNYGWFIDETSGGDAYLSLQSDGITPWGKVEKRNFFLRKPRLKMKLKIMSVLRGKT